MTAWKYGDVLLADLDPSKGHEQKKRRPVVVVSNDDFNRNCSLTVVIAISHGRGDFELHLPIAAVRREDGDGWIDGYAQVEQIRALDLEERNPVKIGHLKEDDMDQITGTLISCYIQPEMMIIPNYA
ncbi:type II toxin-antitoxin system PemK/MazF family toxin [Bifidobacterium callitrichos]|uniref:mRNA interferase n=1 Tax=Bifidobacterium callitrichos DSM 23973 TaxID=1437609 RepID=A0A087A0R0_9BIFI|nr:type II toxin-antitoxin system PemK/MazF family toxin [Bifidobacterium callitrichos]KFI52360.1 transcriptional modulator of MazE/toxin, MazF [Bifidobacterium callitrichos DSM 23973]